MKKLGIILDSFSGRTEKQIKELGWGICPQSIILDGEMFKDGSEIIVERDFKKIYAASDVKSSMPAIGVVIDTFEKMSKEYEDVIYMPMNKGMSSTYSTGLAASSDFKNVHVIENKFCGSAFVDYAKEMVKMAEAGKTISEIITYARAMSDAQSTYVVPKDIDGLIKSGRVSGMKKVILEKAKLVPLLYVSDEGFKVEGLKRNFYKTIRESWEAIIKEIGAANISKYNFEIIHCGDETSIASAKELAEELGINISQINWASAAVCGYTGQSAIGLNAWKK